MSDAPRPGQPIKYGAEPEKRLVAQLDNLPPRGYGAWNGRLLAQTLGVSANWVWATLRRHGISLQRRRSWCISADPEFTHEAADIVGLYLHPPEKRVVLSVDEKPHLQALEQAQGWLRQHPQVHPHFTPTHASWLNQVEVRFNLLARQALRGASFAGVHQLREAVDAFIAVYNPQAVPSEWTKRHVRSVETMHKYAYLHH